MAEDASCLMMSDAGMHQLFEESYFSHLEDDQGQMIDHITGESIGHLIKSNVNREDYDDEVIHIEEEIQIMVFDPSEMPLASTLHKTTNWLEHDKTTNWLDHAITCYSNSKSFVMVKPLSEWQ
ncbi:hypothetical protein FRACYDRAFT_243063 [Fragilariopsis cylindrus CCMP1102]|uniref:Uncharacterized protein n=1 Tax=Fragilariopsis cylindrus CCMP1102 TaxID=635003 RepID=A0A1E7F4V3_9STRA|nr:hypothetical protein FRACYDRAFT_243063 [Fragilariopsis cylindrus CCMP1102]|eukprot:OEU13176.1 hypothetical protein FRACYDRAFT_243063 [Fragilariopsis cylindrus CCMP1102]